MEMKKTTLFSVLVALVLVCLLTPSPALGAKPPYKSLLIADMNVTLEPGAWQGWIMQPSSECGGYMVEVTPLERSVRGAYVEKALVQPEYDLDNDVWWDVLRVMIPADQPALSANVRVYNTCPLPVAADITATLQPGAWVGWALYPSTSIDRGYVVETTPLEPSTYPGASVEAVVQQEFLSNGWFDVLRAGNAPYFPAVEVNLRVYSTAEVPVFGEYEVDLEPGQWFGLPLQPSNSKGAFVVEINPLEAPEAGNGVLKVVVRPEFDGKRWQDVVRIYSPADQPSLRVQVRVYKWAQ
jgi:hypothetical protein